MKKKTSATSAESQQSKHQGTMGKVAVDVPMSQELLYGQNFVFHQVFKVRVK